MKKRTWLHRLGHRIRNWLFRMPFDRAWIEEEVLDDICVLAAGSYPKEMIAFLTGEVKKEGKERVLVINGLYVKGYYANHDSTSFTLHDLPLLDVYGTVHSHPGGNVRPSLPDRRLFASFGWFHLIVGRPYRKENIATYDKKGNRIDRLTASTLASAPSADAR